MIHWTIKYLWIQKGRLLTSSACVAGALILVLFFDAVFLGESKQIVAYVRHTSPDIWVMQKGVSNMHMASSFIWDTKADKIAKISGIRDVTPILYLNSMVHAGGHDWFSYIVGLESENQRAGPWDMARGKSNPETGEIILPVIVSNLTRIEIGDTASIADKKFKVVGFSNNTFSMANSIAFVNFTDLQDILSATGTISYLLVDVEQGKDPSKLAEKIKDEVEKVSVLTQREFIKNDFNMAMKMGVEIISIMTLIGSALAVIIIAFTAYTQVASIKHELAVAKALGVKNHSIYTSVVIQTIIITAIGYLIAIILALFVIPGIIHLAPQFSFLVSAAMIIHIGIIALIVALIAAMIPTYMVIKVDPITAFKV
ncbi:MAG TPA: ABC transporter permease [Thermodesulfobacteriota bacterium]|nr:ABC transporter permease [Thermodesulfobacteriota bacterium]